MRIQDSAFAAVYQAAPAAAQVTAAGAMMVVTAVWHAFTGVLAALMVLLFACDLGLGVLRAIHAGGLKAFCRERFGRAFLKLIAAMVGVVLAVAVDLLLQYIGTVEEATYFTSGIMGGVSLGFLVSAGESLAYFFPGVGLWMDALMRRLRDPGEVPRRRASDREPVAE